MSDKYKTKLKRALRLHLSRRGEKPITWELIGFRLEGRKFDEALRDHYSRPIHELEAIETAVLRTIPAKLRDSIVPQLTA